MVLAVSKQPHLPYLALLGQSGTSTHPYAVQKNLHGTLPDAGPPPHRMHVKFLFLVTGVDQTSRYASQMLFAFTDDMPALTEEVCFCCLGDAVVQCCVAVHGEHEV